MIANNQILTAAGRERLESDLEHMKTARRRELSDFVSAAREQAATGDEADQTSLVEAQEEQLLLELRINELERTLAQAETIEEHVSVDGIVRPGTTVTVRDEDGIDAYTLVGQAEANPRAGRISVTSPVGSALLNHRAGDEVEVPTPSGTRRLLIDKVE